MNRRPATTDELLSHADWVRRLSRALLSDPNEAEDVAQDAWVAALKRPPSAGAGLRAWWARVVRSTASNHRRSETRRADREQRVASERTEATDPQVESTLEAHRRLAAAIDALDEPLRNVIVEHYFHGASSREIAEREGVADSTIRTRLQRALEKLRRELDLRAGGDRKAWAGLLAPLARLEPVPVLLAGWVKLAAGFALIGLAGAATYEWLPNRGAPVEIAASQPASAPAAQQALSAPVADPGRTENPPGPAAAAIPAASAEPLARVAARVLDAHGVPIRGARMMLTDRSANLECTDEEAPQSLSDDAGSVSLSIRDADRSRKRGKRGGLPASTWDGELEFSCRGYATRTVYETLVLGEPSSLGDVVLQDGADLSGRCLASDGTPIPRLRVALMSPDLTLEDRARARSGSFGRSQHLRATLCAPDGSFSMPGVPVGRFRIHASSAKHSAAISDAFVLVKGEQRALPDLLLEDCPVDIRGTVLCADGKPSAGAEIEYTFGAPGEFVGTHAEKDGTFALTGISTPEVDLYARDSDGDSGEAELLGVHPGEKGIVLRVPPARKFEMHVADPSGAPVEHYSVGIHCVDGTGGGGSVNAPGGTYSAVARARPFLVSVRVDGFPKLEQGPFTQDNVPDSIGFRLQPSARVSGRIVSNGVPQKFLEVHLEASLDEPRLCTNGMPQLAEPSSVACTREDGSFSIGAAGAGHFQLWVKGYTAALVFATALDLDPHAPVEGFLIELAAGGTVVGHVATTSETRGRAKQVLYSCGLAYSRFERIAPDGSYRIAGLAPGTWWLRVTSDTSDSSALLPAGTVIEDALQKRVEVESRATTTCDFDAREPASREVQGRVLLDGHAAAVWTAMIAPQERPRDAELWASPARADGSFRLQATTFGTQILSLRSPGTPSRDDVIEARVLVPADGLHWNLACDLGTLEVEGTPAAQIEVLANLPNGATWTTHAILDANGRATLDSLPASKLRVSGAGSPVEVELPAHGRAQVRLP